MSEEGKIYYKLFDGGAFRAGYSPLVLIHGAGGTHLHWPLELRRMAGEIIYSLDLPGHGESRGDAVESVRGYAQRLVGWLDLLDLGAVMLVGHSMGGAISMMMALESPQHVQGLVLVGSGARLRVSPQILTLTEDENLYRQAAELVTQWAFSSHADARMMELAQKRMAEVPSRVIHADFIACDHFDVMDRLAEISMPTLVLCGAEDQMTPVKYSQYLADNIPDARLAIIKDAGHMVMLEKPQEVTKHVRNFIQEII